MERTYYYGEPPTSTISPKSRERNTSTFHQVATSTPTTKAAVQKIVDILPAVFLIATLATVTSDAGASNPPVLHTDSAQPETNVNPSTKIITTQAKPRTSSSGSQEPDGSSIAAALLSLREQSGLTWEEIAQLIGVSRRTIHNWVNGSRVSSANTRALRQVVEFVGENRANTAQETRSRLLAPRPDGGSPYEDLLRALRLGLNQPDATVNPSTRASAIQGKPVDTGKLVAFEDFDQRR